MFFHIGVKTSDYSQVRNFVSEEKNFRIVEVDDLLENKNESLYCTVLYCALLYCTVSHCTVSHCTVLYCTVLYCTVLCVTVLHIIKKDSTDCGSKAEILFFFLLCVCVSVCGVVQ